LSPEHHARHDAKIEKTDNQVDYRTDSTKIVIKPTTIVIHNFNSFFISIKVATQKRHLIKIVNIMWVRVLIHSLGKGVKLSPQSLFSKGNKMTEWILPIGYDAIPPNSIGFTYVIRCIVNNRKYDGRKLLKAGWENYYGSSKSELWLYEFKLYGKESFARQIVEFYYDPKSLGEAEIELQIKDDVLKARLPDGSKEYYNIRIHNVGWDSTGRPMSEKSKKKLRETLQNDPSITERQVENYKKTLKNDPTIIERRKEKQKETLQNDPSITERQVENYKKTLKNDPTIKKKQIEKTKETLKNNPVIKVKSVKKFKETLRNDPSIMEKSMEKRKETLETDPTIMEKRNENLKATLKANPSIVKKRTEKRKETLKKDPSIEERRRENHKATLKKDPTIMERSIVNYLDSKEVEASI
jgi:hypothetical protein